MYVMSAAQVWRTRLIFIDSNPFGSSYRNQNSLEENALTRQIALTDSFFRLNGLSRL
jgi:hypothetical protein